ncbi:MAG: YIP1 family protein, partial [Alphaproteobacteria bacterium]
RMNLPGLVRTTFTDPASAARQILSLRLPRRALALGLAFVVVASTILTYLQGLILGLDGGMMPFARSPLVLAMAQGGMLLLVVHAVHRVGAGLGGHGDFEGALAAVTWVEFVLLLVQLAQTVLLLVIPPVGGIVGMASIVVFLWLLTVFTAELHGFASRWRVFLGIVLTGGAMLLAMSFVLGLVLRF